MVPAGVVVVNWWPKKHPSDQKREREGGQGKEGREGRREKGRKEIKRKKERRERQGRDGEIKMPKNAQTTAQFTHLTC